MDDDLTSDRIRNFLLERLKSGEALIQQPEDVAVEVIDDRKKETLERWKGEPIERLTAFHDRLRKLRRYWQNRAERLKETGVGPYVEDARAHARLNAKYARWEAEAIGDLLREVRHEGPQTEAEEESEETRTSIKSPPDDLFKGRGPKPRTKAKEYARELAELFTDSDEDIPSGFSELWSAVERRKAGTSGRNRVQRVRAAFDDHPRVSEPSNPEELCEACYHFFPDISWR